VNRHLEEMFGYQHEEVGPLTQPEGTGASALNGSDEICRRPADTRFRLVCGVKSPLQ
jgi:hypothetical protein